MNIRHYLFLFMLLSTLLSSCGVSLANNAPESDYGKVTSQRDRD